MVEILREAEKASVAAAARGSKVSERTISSWRQRFAGLEPGDVKKLKALDAGNAKLKGLVAERDLEIDGMREGVRRKW